MSITMQENTLPRPHAWQSLLWKDWKQTEQVAVSVAAGFIGLQILMLLIGLSIREFSPRLEILAGTIVFGFVAPFVGALGCSGMLIGHERQVGSWAWSSSLPISWLSALTSKLLVSTVTCLLIGVALSIIPLALWSLGYFPSGPDGRPFPSATLTWQDVAGMAIPFLFFVEVLLGFFFATLLYRNTVAGMVAAIAGLLLFQPLLMGLGFTFLNHRLSEPAVAIGVAAFFATSLLLATLATFRWRWQSGQSWELASFTSSYLDAATTSERVVTTGIRSHGVAPTEWQSLWQLALQNSLALRVVVVAASIVLGMMVNGPNAANEWSALLLALSCYFLGISAFEGDQTLGRFRFLADRGVNPRKLAMSRLVATAGIALAMVLVAAASRFLVHGAAPNGLILPVCLMTLSVGALSALCFRQAMVSSTFGILILLMGVLLTSAILQFTEQAHVLERLGLTQLALRQSLVVPAYLLALLTWTIPIAGIFWLAPKWIVQEESQLHVHFWWIAFLGVSLPILLASIPLLLRLLG
jgi:hypothetical protein